MEMRSASTLSQSLLVTGNKEIAELASGFVAYLHVLL